MFLRLLAVFLGCTLMVSHAYSREDNLNVSWYGTKRYEKLIQHWNSPISIKEGREIIKSIVIQNQLIISKYGNVPDGPIFAYDNFMFFSNERKDEIHLQGFYLNVDSREVEYRWTDDSVYMKTSLFGLNNKIKVTYNKIEKFNLKHRDNDS